MGLAQVSSGHLSVHTLLWLLLLGWIYSETLPCHELLAIKLHTSRLHMMMMGGLGGVGVGVCCPPSQIPLRLLGM